MIHENLSASFPFKGFCRGPALVDPRNLKVGMASASLEITYLITDREGLEDEQRKRGWITWFTWDTNKIPRQGICTIYVGPPVPLEYQKVPLLGLLLAWAWKPGQISRLGGHSRSRWEFSQKTGEQKRTTWGNQSFRKLIWFLYFWVCLYTFCYT